MSRRSSTAASATARGEDYRVALDEIRRRFRRLTVTQRERVVELIGDPK